MMRRPRRLAGFTLIELLLVLTIIAVVGGFLMMNFPQQIARWRLLSSAQQVSSVIQRCRLESIRRNEAGEASINGDRFEATIGALTFGVPLEGGVTFDAPAGETVVDGFAGTGKVQFRVNGTAEESGAFRLGGQRDYFVEVRIDPPATARTVIRKWDPVTLTYRAQGEGGKSWQW